MTPQRQHSLRLVVLAAVTAAVGGYLYFGVLKADEHVAERKAQSDRILPPALGVAAPGNTVFDTLSVFAKGVQTNLKRRADGWWITSPLEARADAPTVEELLQKLVSGRFKSDVEAHPTDTDLARYGLSPVTFTVTAEGSGISITLEGGVENPYDGSVYVRRKGEPAVHTLEGATRIALDKSTFELRDKQLVPFNPEALASVEAQVKGSRFSLSHLPEGGWTVSAPAPRKADAQAVHAWLQVLRGALAQAFVTDSPEERKARGLSPELVRIVLKPRTGPAITVALGQLRIQGEDPQTYAWVEGGAGGADVLAQVSNGVLDALSKPGAALQDTSLLHYDPKAAAQVEFLDSRGILVARVAKKGKPDAGSTDAWTVLAPSAGPAKQFKMSSILWLLENLKPSAPGPVKGVAKAGLSPAAKTVIIRDAAGKALAMLKLGGRVPGKDATLYAQGSDGQIVELDDARLSELPSSDADLLAAPTAARKEGDGRPARSP